MTARQRQKNTNTQPTQPRLPVTPTTLSRLFEGGLARGGACHWPLHLRLAEDRSNIICRCRSGFKSSRPRGSQGSDLSPRRARLMDSNVDNVKTPDSSPSLRIVNALIKYRVLRKWKLTPHAIRTSSLAWTEGPGVGRSPAASPRVGATNSALSPGTSADCLV